MNLKLLLIKTTTPELQKQRFIQINKVFMSPQKSVSFRRHQGRPTAAFQAELRKLIHANNRKTANCITGLCLGSQEGPLADLPAPSLRGSKCYGPISNHRDSTKVRGPDPCREKMQKEAVHSSLTGLRRGVPSPIFLGTFLHYRPSYDSYNAEGTTIFLEHVGND